MNLFLSSLEVETHRFVQSSIHAERSHSTLESKYKDLQNHTRKNLIQLSLPVYIPERNRVKTVPKSSPHKHEKRKNNIGESHGEEILKSNLNHPMKSIEIQKKPPKQHPNPNSSRLFVPPHPFVISPAMGGEGYDFQDYDHFTDMPPIQSSRRTAPKKCPTPFFARHYSEQSPSTRFLNSVHFEEEEEEEEEEKQAQNE